jgi:hypothetical protein
MYLMYGVWRIWLIRCRVFEQSLGILLKFALNHVEALQIMDLPEFITHAKEVLTEALASDRVCSA